MSISLLLEKYDLSTEDGFQKALNEIEKEELEVNKALSNALSKASALEGRLQTASKAYTKLGEVKNDAQIAADMVEKTAALATDVSAKVRRLDLARARVAECQRRIHDLIDLQVCSAGVEAAIKAHDYETGARHVARYLSMEPGSVEAARARGAPDTHTEMARAAKTLREHLVRKFDEAARKEDDVAVERLYKLFPQIGRTEEGVELLAKYLAIQSESKIRKASATEGVAGGAEAAHADALTRVLEAGAAAVQRARSLMTDVPSYLPQALRHLQPVVCTGARRVYYALVTARDLGSGAPQGAALSAEPALNELALAHSRLQLYFSFLRRNIESDTVNLPEAEKKACVEAVEKIIVDSDLMRTAQDILSHYLELERFFLEESINKALKLSNTQSGGPSSLVDDVFFIARKVIRRSITTGSVDGACAVLNEAASALERCAGGWLRRKLATPPHEPLPLPPPPQDTAPKHNRDLDSQRALYLEYINEAESGAEFAERLASEAVSLCAGQCRGTAELAKLRSCAAGLAGAAAAFRHARHVGLTALRAALQPRAHAWAHHLTASDDGDDLEDMEEEASALPGALEVLAEAARTALPGAADELLAAVLTDLAARAELLILRQHYDRAGGLAVERRARRLAAWAGSNAGGARERCARLTQVGALLALERVSHAPDALRPAARLSPADARDVLSRRNDFKMEEIKRLKL
ncbi:conserved oligomeric Golgi complex subunit 4 [Battus philenor]|uniref:conserved oligomeric Golgi complex subunit 4 n=1 Tax=Battus philenor TaxID=42288 RepID=UPI0035D0E5E9